MKFKLVESDLDKLTSEERIAVAVAIGIMLFVVFI